MTAINRRDAARMIAAATAGVGAVFSGLTAQAAMPVVPQGYLLHPQKGLIAMTNELKRLEAEHFEALVGQSFKIADQTVTLRAVRRGPETPSRFREQFALTFDIPEGSPIRSDVVDVTHPAIGDHKLLVTQVMDSKDPTALEICFS